MLDKLIAIYGNLTPQQASYEVHAKETQYLRSRRIYIPRLPYKKLFKNLEARKKKVRKQGISPNQEDNKERSLRRTKSVLRDLILSNDFDLFVTFTFKTDRQNQEKSKTRMANWFKNQKKRNGKFEYIVIPEFHKDKKSLHFHCLIKGYKGEVKEAINPKTGKPVFQNGRQSFTLPGYTLGFNNVRKIEQTPESHKKIGNYVRKYITKDMPQLFGKNRYWASRGLKRPLVIENPKPWWTLRKPDNYFENEYGTILDFFDKTGESNGQA